MRFGQWLAELRPHAQRVEEPARHLLGQDDFNVPFRVSLKAPGARKESRDRFDGRRSYVLERGPPDARPLALLD